MPTRKLVIGIDFGTSNSGVAYALFEDDNDGQIDIEVIRTWPHRALSRDASDKVPSEIAYDKSGTAIGHGFEMPEGARPLQWVKLLLDPAHFQGLKETQHTERVWRTYEELEKLGKRPVDAISDYLTWLWSRVQSAVTVAESEPEVFSTSEVTVVLTVPAQWPDRAKHGMIAAAKKSGIDGPGRKLKFRAEPEAAAIFELKTRARRGQVKDGDCVIICDAGGGTVDVVTYKVLTRNPISLDQIVVSKGDMCGSAFVDSEFEYQLRSILGSDFDKLSTATLAQIRDDFEYKIKRTYNLERPQTYSIPVTGLSDDPDRGIQDGRLKVNDSDLRIAFEGIMTQIMSLIDGQKAELVAKGLGNKLKGILLVGGFGGSEYLHVRVRQEYPEDQGIKVWRGDQSWTAVAQGAVACEAFNQQHHHSINTRLSSYNYGIANPEGNAGKVQWLVKKGQAIKSEGQAEPFLLRWEEKPGLTDHADITTYVSLIKTNDDEASEDLNLSSKSYVYLSCRVPARLRQGPQISLAQGSHNIWQIPAELVLILDGPVLSVRCIIKGQDVGAVGLSYGPDDEGAPRRDSAALSPKEIIPPVRSPAVSRDDSASRRESAGPLLGENSIPLRPSVGSNNANRPPSGHDNEKDPRRESAASSRTNFSSPGRPALVSRDSMQSTSSIGSPPLPSPLSGSFPSSPGGEPVQTRRKSFFNLGKDKPSKPRKGSKSDDKPEPVKPAPRFDKQGRRLELGDDGRWRPVEENKGSFILPR